MIWVIFAVCTLCFFGSYTTVEAKDMGPANVAMAVVALTGCFVCVAFQTGLIR